MRTFVLYDGPRYRLVSHGGGLAYLLTRKAIGEKPQEEVFVQGDDALAMEAEWEAYEGHMGVDGTSWDSALHYLWEHCGYGELV